MNRRTAQKIVRRAGRWLWSLPPVSVITEDPPYTRRQVRQALTKLRKCRGSRVHAFVIRWAYDGKNYATGWGAALLPGYSVGNATGYTPSGGMAFPWEANAPWLVKPMTMAEVITWIVHNTDTDTDDTADTADTEDSP
jgi:hypothetical protein